MKIIIVDDEVKALHTFLSDVLDSNSVEYKFFKDDPDAIVKYCLNNVVDAAFLDINMPNINGLKLAERIVEVKSVIKIVFVTGLSATLDDVPSAIKQNVLGFIYKPYEENDIEKYLSLIEKTTPKLIVKMFDTFDCFMNDRIVKFSSFKSKELFALLLVYNGKSLTMNDAISQLWPETDINKSKILYRDAVWRLRKTLKEINFNCVDFQRATLFLKKNHIICDYWSFLENPDDYTYQGEFLKSYDWSISYISLLDELKAKKEY